MHLPEALLQNKIHGWLNEPSSVQVTKDHNIIIKVQYHN